MGKEEKDHKRRDRKRSRSRSRSRSKERRSKRRRSRSRSHSRDRDRHRSRRSHRDRDRDKSKRKESDKKIKTEDKKEDLSSLTTEEMMKRVGLPVGFDTSKDKPGDEASTLSGARIKSRRQFRQYMNRRGGFNRPLSKSY